MSFQLNDACASFDRNNRSENNRLIIRKASLAVALALSLSGCMDHGGEATENTGTAADSPADLAVLDLSERLEIPVEDIKVLSEESVTWRDGSLGCPKPDMMYTQALVEGMRIILQAKGKDYAYHSGQGRPPFFCENPVSPAAAPAEE